MCGIVGVYRRDGAPADSGLVQRMADRIAHRGPDAEGFWNEGQVALGHRRLAIRDLTPAGAQPFHSPDNGIVVAYNGELYNEDELIRDLGRASGFVRRTRSDTELIPAAYLVWGIEAFDRLEGMFAIALWDRAKGQLVLARDGIGIKPLYIEDDGTSLRFASELKALLVDKGRRRQLSAPDLTHMLALGFPAPTRTLIDGIRQLAPGSVLVADGRETREHKFWQPRRAANLVDLETATDRFIETFSSVVSSQLVSDVPVGVMQSGGIDSSLVSMALPRGHDVPLFSVRFAESSHDESGLARRLAQASGRSLMWVDLPVDEDVERDFRAVVDAVDGQLADSSALATYALSRAIRDNVTVALSGDGGDEFFAGYPTYLATAMAAPAAPVLSRLPGLWGGMAALLHAVTKPSEARIPRSEKLYRFLAGLAHPVPHATWRHYLPSWQRSRLYGPGLSDLPDQDPLAGYAASYQSAHGDCFDRAVLADQNYYLPADMLVKVDRMSMAHGLEVRVPFLDRRIMDLAGQMSRSVLYGRGGESKRVLRRALMRLGGPEPLARSPKRGFNIPMNMLLRGPMKKMARRMLDQDADMFAPFLSPDGVRAVWRDHADGRKDGKYVIWTLLTIGAWREMEGVF
ncbi:MAG: asparagine synthase (glutamine-hydrolyzing) [Magnetospirillum sp.]|nr:asparagine synthase (glutamine-hydrolyzing) [Magnetospirillum sp.]